jgi:hypothetical protein
LEFLSYEHYLIGFIAHINAVAAVAMGALAIVKFFAGESKSNN